MKITFDIGDDTLKEKNVKNDCYLFQCLTHGVMESDMEVYTLQSELEQMELSLHKKMEKKRTMKPLPPSPTTEQPSTSDRLKRLYIRENISIFI